MKSVARFVIVAALVCGVGFAHAAQQGAPAKLLKVVKRATKGLVIYKVIRSGNTLVGDPRSGGATLNVQLTPGGTQCFQMPAGGWERRPGMEEAPLLGYRYTDSPSSDPKIRAQFRQSKTGALKLIVKVSGPAVTVAPGNPTTDHAVTFHVPSGDDYCTSRGTGGTVRVNNPYAYIVGRDDGMTCALAACSPSGAFLDASLDTPW